MRYLPAASLCLMLLPICSCTFFENAKKEPPPPPVVPKVLAVPVGKNWQVIEEAPTLTNERHERTLPLQSEQSIQPPGAQPVVPTEQRTITTPPK